MPAESKWLGEQMADAFARRRPALQIASFRFHMLVGADDASRVEGWLSDPEGAVESAVRDWWGWTGKHDMGRACRMAVEKTWEGFGHQVFHINGRDTRLLTPTAEVIVSRQRSLSLACAAASPSGLSAPAWCGQEKYYPGTELKRPMSAHESCLSPAKAKEFLGWEPEESWRDGPEGLLPPTDCSHVATEKRSPWHIRSAAAL